MTRKNVLQVSTSQLRKIHEKAQARIQQELNTLIENKEEVQQSFNPRTGKLKGLLASIVTHAFRR